MNIDFEFHRTAAKRFLELIDHSSADYTCNIVTLMS